MDEEIIETKSTFKKHIHFIHPKVQYVSNIKSHKYIHQIRFFNDDYV